MREKDALLPEDAKLGADFRRDRDADETLLIDGNGRVEKGTAAAAFQIVHHRRQLAEVELHARREAEGAGRKMVDRIGGMPTRMGRTESAA